MTDGTLVRIVRGTPTDAELAALVSVLLRPVPATAPPAVSRWARSMRPGARTGWR